jgi:signal transduction histidine kinase
MAKAASFGIAPSTVAAPARASLFGVRATVVVCLVLIAGSFAAASAIQMRLDRAHALSQAAYYEQRRAGDIAAVAGRALDRYAAAGRAFVDHSDMNVPAGVRNIALFDRSGVWGEVLHGSAVDFPDMPNGWIVSAIHGPTAFGSFIAFAHGGRIVAVLFDPRSLVPPELMDGAELSGPDGKVLAGGPLAEPGQALTARTAHWPVFASTSVDVDGALAAWRGALPLYLFVILGPALAGACLAPLFVEQFERRARAVRAVHTLKSAGAMERHLLVRLAEAERRAVEAVRSKSEFIAHMSHELRTPLNAVIGFAEIIEGGLYGPTGHPKYVEYAHDIADAGRNLHNKIGDILEYANVEAGRYPLSREILSLCDLAQVCINEHQGRAFSRRVSLELGDVEPVDAIGDEGAVKRIVSLLMANALSYARDNGRVRVDIREEPGAAVLVVRDTGMGFSEGEKKVAGQAFRRFDRTSGRTGAGLGLAIATALAHRMGGALVIGGHHGLGAVVELRLPAADATA